jgi:hypothetical protein
MKTNSLIAACAVTGMSAGLVSGCGTTSTSQGASLGAVVGGLSDGWGGAATGALIGGGVGYLADRSDDKAAAKAEQDEREAALEMARITTDPATAYRPPNINPLTGSTWRAISIVSDKIPPGRYGSVVVTFQTNSNVTTLAIPPQGEPDVYVETYGVVDDVLILSREENGESYVVNAKFSLADNQLIIVAEGLRIVLEEVEETAWLDRHVFASHSDIVCPGRYAHTIINTS